MRLLLFAPLFIFLQPLHAQTKPNTDTLRNFKLVYALKANSFLLQLPTYSAPTVTAYGVDYSFFVQCGRAGLFVGYTPLYSASTLQKNTSPLNAINFGIQYQLTPLNKASSFYLCLYAIHTNQANYNFPTNKTNLVNFNPRYQYTFCKHLLSVEVGLIAGLSSEQNILNRYNRHVYNINGYYGCNAGLAFNFGALFIK